MFEWFQTQFLIDFFSWDIRYYSASYCLTSIILDRFYFLMEWCIECFLVKNISVAEIGVIKGFIKGNQSLLLCNHALTHFLSNFTISLSYYSNSHSFEKERDWGDFFRMIENCMWIKMWNQCIINDILKGFWCPLAGTKNST